MISIKDEYSNNCILSTYPRISWLFTANTMKYKIQNVPLQKFSAFLSVLTFSFAAFFQQKESKSVITDIIH